MKKALSMILAVVMVASLFATLTVPATAETQTEIGSVAEGYTPSGTAITSAEQFAAMQASGTYYLANDIDLSGLEKPYYDGCFKGKFDGNGHTITLYGYAAFKSTRTATIKNLKLAGNVTKTVTITAESGSGDPADTAGVYLASVSYVNREGRFDNILNTANITSESGTIHAGGIYGTGTWGTTYINKCKNAGTISVGGFAGGIVAYTTTNYAAIKTEITNCINAGTITSTGKSAGGIVGRGQGTDIIKNCENTGNVTSNVNYTGGIIGQYYTNQSSVSITVENCKNSGTIESTSTSVNDSHAGGIFARADSKANVTITNCENSGAVKSYNSYAGGIVAEPTLNANTPVVNITSCTNNGTVTSTKSVAAGIVANANNGNSGITVNITSCINKGEVNAPAFYAGGILGRGRVNNTIEKCVNAGTVTAKGAQVAGIVGYYWGVAASVNLDIKNCVNIGKIANGNTASPACGILGAADGAFNLTFENNLNAGTLSGGRFGLFKKSAGTMKNCSGNYYLEGVDPANDGYTTGMTSFTAAQLASGEIAYKINADILGAQTFYQTLGTDKAPVLDSTHGVVSFANEAYFNDVFDEASVSVGDSIKVNYYIDDIVYTAPKMTFTMNEKSVTVEGVKTADGRYKFVFEGVAPQCLGDEITAVLNNGETVVATKNYSVVEYLTKLKTDNASDAKLMALVNDLLVYGGAAQAYKGQTNTLGNGVTGSTYEAPVAAAYKLNDSKITWKTATVLFDSVNKIKITFEADDITGITFTCNDAEITPVSNGDGTYTVITDAISAVELDKVFRIMTSSEDPEAANISYSVATYVLAKDDGDTAMANLVKALYNYGCSAKAYANAQ